MRSSRTPPRFRARQRRPLAPHAADGHSRQDGGGAAGDSLHLRRLYRPFNRVAQSAGLHDIRLPDARQGTATLLTAAGLAPRVVMEILGYSQISNHHGRIHARRARHPARGHEIHGPAAQEVPRSSVTVAVGVRPGCQTPRHRCIWHGSDTNPSRRQPATTAGTPTDHARVCLAAPPPVSATLSACVVDQYKPRRPRHGDVAGAPGRVAQLCFIARIAPVWRSSNAV